MSLKESDQVLMRIAITSQISSIPVFQSLDSSRGQLRQENHPFHTRILRWHIATRVCALSEHGNFGSDTMYHFPASHDMDVGYRHL